MSPTRRELLLGAGASAASLLWPGCLSVPGLPSRELPAGERPGLACIGMGGQGWMDVQKLAAAGAEVRALCDVDRSPALGFWFLKSAARLFPEARIYRDFREMLAAEAGRIDAVSISAPDHVHCHAATLALRQGKHVFCQKPLAHSIGEARWLARLASETGLVTQMGNQGHARDHLRRAVELLRAGLVGRVREVHAWTDRPIWPQGMARLPEPGPVPDDLDWDLWLGPAPEQPYAPGFHPFAWRGWWAFGTGALGDMGCHILDLPVWALELGPPTQLEAHSEGQSEVAAPRASTVVLHFAAGPHSDALALHWYDGGRLPPEPLWAGLGGVSRGALAKDWDCLLIGSEGRLLFDHRGGMRTSPAERLDAFADTPRSLPRVANEAIEWIDAIRGRGVTLSGFERSGPFTEIVLAGNVAVRLGRKVTWDGAAMRSPDAPEADAWVRRRYRSGWALG